MLPKSEFFRLRNQVCGELQHKPKPAYNLSIKDISTNYNAKNINDFLKFEVALVERDRILTHWHENYTHSSQRDDVLAGNRDRMEEKAFTDSSGVIRQICEHLKEDIKAIGDRWWQILKANYEGIEFSKKVNSLHKDYLQIQPYVVEGHEDHRIYGLFDDSAEFESPIWPKIRASYIYDKYHRGLKALPWNMAADELCEMKAKSLGLTVTMTMSMWSAVKVDKRIAASMSTWATIECHDVEDSYDEETQYFDAETDFSQPADTSIFGWLKF